MTRISRLTLGFASLCLLVAPIASLAAGAHDHHGHGGHSGHKMAMASHGDFESHDLSELADGETREFGTGEHTITATRAGDQVTIMMPEGEGGVRDLICAINEDRCMVLVGSEGDSETRKVIVMRKTTGGEGEEEMDISVTSADAGSMVFVGHDAIGELHPDHEGHGDECENVFVHKGSPTTMTWHSAGGEGAHVVRTGHGDKVPMRCPEGDTTMLLGKDELDVEYRCPKHGVLLEKAERRMMQKVIIEEIHTSESEER